MQTHPSKSAQKNMLKASGFTKNKRCQRYLDKLFSENFQTNILENGTVQIIVGLWLKFQIEIVD